MKRRIIKKENGDLESLKLKFFDFYFSIHTFFFFIFFFFITKPLYKYSVLPGVKIVNFNRVLIESFSQQ